MVRRGLQKLSPEAISAGRRPVPLDMKHTMKPSAQTYLAGSAVAALFLTGCNSGESDSTGPYGGAPDQEEDSATEELSDDEELSDAEATGETMITIAGHDYQTPDTVAPGAEITVTNEDSEGHTVTSEEEGIFDVSVPPGETVTFTAPQEPGEYDFFCIPHPQMTDTLIVE